MESDEHGPEEDADPANELTDEERQARARRRRAAERFVWHPGDITFIYVPGREGDAASAGESDLDAPDGKATGPEADE